MYYCHACGHSFSKKSSLQGHCGHCEKHREFRRECIARHLTPEFLTWWFSKKFETALHLCNLFNAKYKGVLTIHPPFVISLAHSYGIDTNGFSCYSKCPRLHRNYMGERNVGAKGNRGYLARQATLAKEGITNVYQRPEVICKIKETMRKKYGVTNASQLPWYTGNHGQESRPHKIVLEYLKELGVSCISEMDGMPKAAFLKYNLELGKEYAPRPDIIIPELRVIIEIYGNRWHADPCKYADTDIIHLWTGPVTAREIRRHDAIRKRHLEEFGYSVYVLWASEIHTGAHRDKIKNIILSNTKGKNTICFPQ